MEGNQNQVNFSAQFQNGQSTPSDSSPPVRSSPPRSANGHTNGSSSRSRSRSRSGSLGQERRQVRVRREGGLDGDTSGEQPAYVCDLAPEPEVPIAGSRGSQQRGRSGQSGRRRLSTHYLESYPGDGNEAAYYVEGGRGSSQDYLSRDLRGEEWYRQKPPQFGGVAAPARRGTMVMPWDEWADRAAAQQFVIPPGLPRGIECCHRDCQIDPVDRFDLEVPECGLPKWCFKKRPKKPVAPPELIVNHETEETDDVNQHFMTMCDRHIDLQFPLQGGGIHGCPSIPGLECNVGKCINKLCGCCCKKDVRLPEPYPTTALGFATCWDGEVAARTRHRPPKKPEWGFTALCKDAVGLTVLTAAACVATVGKIVDATCGPFPQAHEGCLNEVRYPNKNGYFDARPQQPTRMTGNAWLDRINRFLDELCVTEHTSDPAKEHVPVDLPTQETGNAWIDQTNKFLDSLLAPPPELTESTRPEAERPPPKEKKLSSFTEKVRCVMHCRDTCGYEFDDCAGLKFQRHFLETGREVQVPQTWYERLLGIGQDPLEVTQYREKVGERFLPRLYGRNVYYCPHCHKNRYTGKERVHCELPTVKAPIITSPALKSNVDFNLSHPI